MNKKHWRRRESQRKRGQTKRAEQRPETMVGTLNAEWKATGGRLALGWPLQNGSPKEGLKTVATGKPKYRQKTKMEEPKLQVEDRGHIWN